MMVVVSYDVSTKEPGGPRRLRHVAKACRDYGQRVQNSVFECIVDPEQWARLRLRLLDIFEPEEDSLRFYFLGANYARRVEHHGTKVAINMEGPLVV
ncbi:MAG TPA: CRISPR-associated endonuclease Cas2 [Thermoanaerobaculaceae bacterium]|nr:CRISPR-associated endonuclease Cas2 [Thermoanaerobaculaceae bacterium]HRS15474.1 CRISPR-associated endonuclease Cas2 [Thermoanaerobaculaceae bacterium]